MIEKVFKRQQNLLFGRHLFFSKERRKRRATLHFNKGDSGELHFYGWWREINSRRNHNKYVASKIKVICSAKRPTLLQQKHGNGTIKTYEDKQRDGTQNKQPSKSQWFHTAN